MYIAKMTKYMNHLYFRRTFSDSVKLKRLSHKNINTAIIANTSNVQTRPDVKYSACFFVSCPLGKINADSHILKLAKLNNKVAYVIIISVTPKSATDNQRVNKGNIKIANAFPPTFPMNTNNVFFPNLEYLPTRLFV